MKPGKIALYICLFLLMAVSTVRANEMTAAIQEKYESLTGVKTAYEQVLINASTQEKETRAGTIYFKNPGLVRWETDTPEQELLVVGRKFVWDYFSDEQVVYKYYKDEILDSKTVIRFISGQADLEEDFEVTDMGLENGWRKLELVPRQPEPGLVLAYLWAEPETFLIRRVRLIDFFGNENQVTLDDLELNIPLSDSLFTFEPPADVTVMDNTEG